MNFPTTHWNSQQHTPVSEYWTYALCLQMGTSEAVHVLVEVHHLEAIELVGNRLDLISLARLDNLNTFCIPEGVSVADS